MSGSSIVPPVPLACELSVFVRRLSRRCRLPLLFLSSQRSRSLFPLLRSEAALPRVSQAISADQPLSIKVSDTAGAVREPGRSRVIVGRDLRCSLAIPADWRVREPAQDFDIFASQDDVPIIIGVIAEEARFDSSETVATTIRARLRESMTGFDNSPPSSARKTDALLAKAPSSPAAPPTANSPDRRAAPSTTQTIQGIEMPYTIAAPSDWTVKRRVEDCDVLLSRKSLYICVIAEEARLGTPETVAKVARGKLKESSPDVRFSEPTTIRLDGRSWLDFSAKCTTENIPFAYRFSVYSGREGTFQLVGYTTQELYERDVASMQEVMASFRFPAQ